MENRNALESKYQRILNELGEQATFYIEDIQRIFPDMKKSTLYWNMSKLVDGGYLKRVRNGVYSFNEWKRKKERFIITNSRKNTRYIGRNEDLIIIYPGWIFYRNTCYTYQNSIPL